MWHVDPLPGRGLLSLTSIDRASDISRGRRAAKSREIPKNTRISPKFARNLTKYLSAQNV